MSEDDNFYLVLPSNSCPLTQPDNNASYFIVDWQNAINLHGSWEAALTEFTYLFSPFSVSKNNSIKYKFNLSILELSYDIPLIKHNVSGKFRFKNEEMWVGDRRINIFVANDTINKNKMIFSLTNFPPSSLVTIEFKTLEEAKIFGFSKKQYNLKNKENILISESIVSSNIEENKEYKVKCLILKTYEMPGEAKLKNDIECMTIKEITKELMNMKSSPAANPLFKNIIVHDDGNIQFIFHYYVTSVEFPDILKNMFHITTKSFQPVNGTKSLIYTATFNVPESKINQLYIYSSLVNPILVGGVRVPLLRTIPINQKFTHGEMFTKVIEKPMYIPTSSTSINNIEINIRDDSGQLVKFSYGSKTILTIHLRKRK